MIRKYRIKSGTHTDFRESGTRIYKAGDIIELDDQSTMVKYGQDRLIEIGEEEGEEGDDERTDNLEDNNQKDDELSEKVEIAEVESNPAKSTEANWKSVLTGKISTIKNKIANIDDPDLLANWYNEVEAEENLKDKEVILLTLKNRYEDLQKGNQK